MSWRPTATAATLEFRARVLATVRAFFAERNVLEVETPSLSIAGATDPALRSLTTRVGALGDARVYLQTSPEFPMKRLLAADSGDIYQICRVYRDGELGRWHQPEFTMLEWYRRGWDDARLMDEVGTLIDNILGLAGKRYASLRLEFDAAFERFAGVSARAAPAVLESALTAHGIAVPPAVGHDALLDLLLSTVVVPSLPRSTISFVHDFPANQAALARIEPATGTAARFEAFVDGVELANGFAELTDATEQRRRFESEIETRRRAGIETPPLDERLLDALTSGLPDCAGVAIGLDRLIAAALGLSGVAASMAFAHSREAR